ncbi:MAG TPA: alanine--tRNA ligase-related protein [Acidisarcina sp.]|nr:alanine--tRNA ligase-related protein [Acidisarcina sp.]
MVERLYYTDSFLSRFPARVTDVREVSRTAGQSLWQLALDRTAFYPTSGGQPNDTGTLLAASRSGATLEVPVLDVQEDESGEVWHFTEKPLASGTQVEAVIDWPRRLDHMQQHSGQHLLSAVFAAEFEARTVSFHLGEESSTIDLAAENISSTGLEKVEQIANAMIAEDRRISATTVSRDQAEALLAAGRLPKLPERSGTMRLIEIDHYDLNACGGTHLRSTGQIGGIHLRSTERVRQGVRVEFVCGQRAARAARHDYSLLMKTSALLSVGAAELPPAVERLLGEAKSSAKERQKLREELSEYHAARLIVEDPMQDGLRVVQRVFADRDAAYCKLLASRVAAAAPRTVALIGSAQQEPATVVMAASKGLHFSCADLLRDQLAQLGLRGGGSPEMAQGQVPRKQLESLLHTLAAEARTGQ